MEQNEIAIDRGKLKILLDNTGTLEKTIEAQRAEIRALYDGSIKVMEIIGLAENGIIKAEAFEEGGGAIPEILKGASSIIGLVMQSQVPVIGKKAEKKLIERFSFFQELIPLFIKYGNEFKLK